MVTVGVLALQGDFDAHAKALASAGDGVLVRRVRTPADLAGLAGLVLPGGESTTMLKLLAMEGLDAALVAFAREGGVVFGTCAGAILLSRDVKNPAQASLGLLDTVIERNSYGRQVDSFITEILPTAEGRRLLGEAPLPAVFIRAPRFLSTGAGVAVLAREGDDPVLVRSGSVLAATFHPELTRDTRAHALFLRLAAERFGTGAGTTVEAAPPFNG